jgi:hypothetical protein
MARSKRSAKERQHPKLRRRERLVESAVLVLVTGRGKDRKVKYHIDSLADAGISPRIEMLSAASRAARGNGTSKVGQT